MEVEEGRKVGEEIAVRESRERVREVAEREGMKK